jgi:elongator complex protein 2
VKIWTLKDNNADCVLSITATAAVTAVSCDITALDDGLRLAYGTEDGSLHIVNVTTSSWEVVADAALDRNVVPSGAVNSLRWRPLVKSTEADESKPLQLSQLAVASDDGSVRILNIG